MMKRSLDVTLALFGLLLLAPLLAALAIVVKIGDGGPIFYRQQRVGRLGRPFYIWKFRSMRVDSDSLGPSITSYGDERVTTVGRLLRDWKLDELPQLWNVLKGEMSFVGPRPEVAKYVAQYSEEQKAVLLVLPGITDMASLVYRDEERMLATAPDPEEYYLERCMPEKIRINLDYAKRSSLLGDLWLIILTVLTIIRARLPSGKIGTKSISGATR